MLDIVLARNLLSREKLDDILAPEHMIKQKVNVEAISLFREAPQHFPRLC